MVADPCVGIGDPGHSRDMGDFGTLPVTELFQVLLVVKRRSIGRLCFRKIFPLVALMHCNQRPKTWLRSVFGTKP